MNYYHIIYNSHFPFKYKHGYWIFTDYLTQYDSNYYDQSILFKYLFQYSITNTSYLYNVQ
jgi:hypothetical protein